MMSGAALNTRQFVRLCPFFSILHIRDNPSSFPTAIISISSATLYLVLSFSKPYTNGANLSLDWRFFLVENLVHISLTGD
jgi:hypothetical protein